MSTFSGTVRPARGRGSSSQTRSIVAVRGCSVDVIVRSSPSISTGSKSLRSRNVIGATT